MTADAEVPSPIPAATVVFVRDADGVETLMLHKNSKIAFGGMWVFPGGRVDPEDSEGAGDEHAAARRAAVREAEEEAGLTCDLGSLITLSHWLPPGLAPKRFSTWFFVAAAPAGTVRIDGGEIQNSAWMRPTDALARRDAGEVELAPPTWMTLRYLSEFADVAALLDDARRRTPVFYETRVAPSPDGMVAMWAGDAGYESREADTAGARHRLYIGPGPWTLERRPD